MNLDRIHASIWVLLSLLKENGNYKIMFRCENNTAHTIYALYSVFLLKEHRNIIIILTFIFMENRCEEMKLNINPSFLNYSMQLHVYELNKTILFSKLQYNSTCNIRHIKVGLLSVNKVFIYRFIFLLAIEIYKKNMRKRFARTDCRNSRKPSVIYR
jgi:hypothetical protein